MHEWVGAQGGSTWEPQGSEKQASYASPCAGPCFLLLLDLATPEQEAETETSLSRSPGASPKTVLVFFPALAEEVRGARSAMSGQSRAHVGILIGGSETFLPSFF